MELLREKYISSSFCFVSTSYKLKMKWKQGILFFYSVKKDLLLTKIALALGERAKSKDKHIEIRNLQYQEKINSFTGFYGARLGGESKFIFFPFSYFHLYSEKFQILN
jgi:hypothetical protein